MITEDQTNLRMKSIQAIKAGNKDAVADLLKNSLFNPALADDEGVTPLLQAVWHDQIKIVEMLLPHLTNEQINAQEKWDGSCAFMAAAHLGKTEIFKILLARLAPKHIDIKDWIAESTALQLAACRGHSDIIALLLPYLSEEQINYKNTCGDTALSWACNEASKQILKKRLQELQT